MSKQKTFKDVAAPAGVSIATASRTFNDTRYPERPQLRQLQVRGILSTISDENADAVKKHIQKGRTSCFWIRSGRCGKPLTTLHYSAQNAGNLAAIVLMDSIQSKEKQRFTTM